MVPLLLHHFLSWKFLHCLQSLCSYYSVFCGCCGNCFMSSLFCVVVMSLVLGPFLQFLIHVVVQRLLSRFWGCCYNIFHCCCGSHSSSLLCVVLLHWQQLFLSFFFLLLQLFKDLLKFSWLLLFMVSRLPWEPLYIITICVVVRSLVVIIFFLFYSIKFFLLIYLF